MGRSETSSASADEENKEEVLDSGRTPRSTKRKSMKEVDEESDEETSPPSKIKSDEEEEPEADAEDSADEAKTSSPSSRKKKQKSQPKNSDDEGEENGAGSSSGRTPRRAAKRKSQREIDEEEESAEPPTSGRTPRSASKRKPAKDVDEEGSAPTENEENEVPVPKKAGRKKKETPVKEDKDPEYEVEAIVDDRVIKGRVQYKIRWKGYESEDDTWENESTLDCAELVEEYNDSKGDSGRTNGSARAPANPPKGRGRPPSKDGRKKKKKATSPKKDTKKAALTHNAPDKNGEWEVSKLIDMHTLKNGSREFLVRWKGYSAEDDSWEPESHLKGTEILEKFLKKVEQNVAPSRVGSRRTAEINDEEEEPTRTEVDTPRRRVRTSESTGQPEDTKHLLAKLEQCLSAVIDKKNLAKQDKVTQLVKAVDALRKENSSLRAAVEQLRSKIV